MILCRAIPTLFDRERFQWRLRRRDGGGDCDGLCFTLPGVFAAVLHRYPRRVPVYIIQLYQFGSGSLCCQLFVGCHRDVGPLRFKAPWPSLQKSAVYRTTIIRYCHFLSCLTPSSEDFVFCTVAFWLRFEFHHSRNNTEQRWISLASVAESQIPTCNMH